MAREEQRAHSGGTGGTGSLNMCVCVCAASFTARWHCLKSDLIANEQGVVAIK